MKINLSKKSNFQPLVKSTKVMSYSEIECILQMQELQLISSNPFIDDFYFQCSLSKKLGLLYYLFIYLLFIIYLSYYCYYSYL